MKWILLLSLCSCGGSVDWDNFEHTLKSCDANEGVWTIDINSDHARITCKNGAVFNFYSDKNSGWKIIL